jgi:hypothetical protein
MRFHLGWMNNDEKWSVFCIIWGSIGYLYNKGIPSEIYS